LNVFFFVRFVLVRGVVLIIFWPMAARLLGVRDRRFIVVQTLCFSDSRQSMLVIVGPRDVSSL
jgi:hypothetical protein